MNDSGVSLSRTTKKSQIVISSYDLKNGLKKSNYECEKILEVDSEDAYESRRPT